jgi:hypothetical protein
VPSRYAYTAIVAGLTTVHEHVAWFLLAVSNSCQTEAVLVLIDTFFGSECFGFGNFDGLHENKYFCILTRIGATTKHVTTMSTAFAIRCPFTALPVFVDRISFGMSFSLILFDFQSFEGEGFFVGNNFGHTN